ncbi:MAG: DNA polymerase III subunit gamma/tau [Microthrixaceae bacterium]
MTYQSLYRRFRPSTFAEVRGQDHITVALRNAVRTDTVGHAYMFSGPRGCGKTSTARILGRALNCTDLADGEPCGACDSCLAMEAGTSMDLHELDAASNNGVDAMRDLVSRAGLGSAGRNKVYILDEVHMLSGAASNALLKTLEEPPPHVTFVLATTDPQKVLPTIKSRTQHFNFELLSPAELEDYVRWVIGEADLSVAEDAIGYVVRQGRGSARDTLSALDQVVAGGGVVPREEPSAGLVSALAEQDTGAALAAVADALGQGSDPRVLAEALVADLRDLFLLTMGVEGANVTETDREELTELSRRFGPARLTRALEQLGTSLVDMRQASDPRVPLEVALVRLTAPAADLSVEALADRVEALERALAAGVAPTPSPTPAAGGEPAAVAPPAAVGPRDEPAPAAEEPSPEVAAATEGAPASAGPAPAAAPAAPGPTSGASPTRADTSPREEARAMLRAKTGKEPPKASRSRSIRRTNRRRHPVGAARTHPKPQRHPGTVGWIRPDHWWTPARRPNRRPLHRNNHPSPPRRRRRSRPPRRRHPRRRPVRHPPRRPPVRPNRRLRRNRPPRLGPHHRRRRRPSNSTQPWVT